MTYEYLVNATLKGGYFVERGPSWWRGSHVNDVKVPCEGEVEFTVWAKDEAEARRLVNKYDDFQFSDDWYMEEVDDVVINQIVPTGRSEDDNEASVEETAYGHFWEKEDDGPDADDIRDERLMREREDERV